MTGLRVEDIPGELRDFLDVFEAGNASLLPRHKATDHAIDIINGETPPYGPIYLLLQVELRELRDYL